MLSSAHVWEPIAAVYRKLLVGRDLQDLTQSLQSKSLSLVSSHGGPVLRHILQLQPLTDSEADTAMNLFSCLKYLSEPDYVQALLLAVSVSAHLKSQGQNADSAAIANFAADCLAGLTRLAGHISPAHWQCAADLKSNFEAVLNTWLLYWVGGPGLLDFGSACRSKLYAAISNYVETSLSHNEVDCSMLSTLRRVCEGLASSVSCDPDVAH
eukprot:scaffold278842_cov43-Prasinocladus_malaysianus.AAC.1